MRGPLWMLLGLVLLVCAPPAYATRDLASGDYMDAGAAANTAMASPFTVAVLFNADSIGTMQVLMSRAVTAFTNGWDFRIESTGFLSLFNYESDSATGTATTAPTAGVWYGLAAIMSGSGSGQPVKFVRFRPSTGALSSETVTMFVGPSPTGTHKMVIGGRWSGVLSNSAPGVYARAGVWSGVALTDDQLKTWWCTGSAASGGDGLWELTGAASPELDSSGNGYSATLSGTTNGIALDACPSSAPYRLPMGMGQ